MTKSTRLLQLLHTLRHRKHPTTAALAAELNISPRTLYRDINTLRAQGADIRGEAGIGYQLHSDHSQLPPLMFSQSELEAIIIGIRWAARNTEPSLAQAAENALTKIRSVLPPWLAHTAANAQFSISPAPQYREAEIRALAPIRQALRENRRLIIGYTDQHGNPAAAKSSPSRWAISPKCACWPHGASNGKTSAISAATASKASPLAAPAPRRTNSCCANGSNAKTSAPKTADTN